MIYDSANKHCILSIFCRELRIRLASIGGLTSGNMYWS